MEMIQLYKSRYQVEDDFKWLHDKIIIPLWPFFVRLDVSVRTHVFICVLGLMLYRYLIWELDIDGLSIPKLVSILDEIRLSILLEKHKKPRFVTEEMSKEQLEIFSKLNLERFVPSN